MRNVFQVRFFQKYVCELLTKVYSYYQSKKSNFLEQCIEVSMNKISGSVVTQTVLGGLTLCPPVGNFP